MATSSTNANPNPVPSVANAPLSNAAGHVDSLHGFEFISGDTDELYNTFNSAEKTALPWFQPFAEFERIADAEPHPGIDKSMPKVTDGTLANEIDEQPKRVIQQVPTAKVQQTSDDWLSIVADFIIRTEIIPNDDQIAALIQKCWGLTSKSLTYGSQPAFVQFINKGDYFGTGFSLPYIKDVILEEGKLSDRDSNVIFLKSWFRPSQIRQIIAKEKMLGESATKRGDTYQSGWDVVNLQEILDGHYEQQKDANSKSTEETAKNVNNGYILLVTAFQRGIGANFYTFHPRSKLLVRTKKNPDPRGVIPIHMMYAVMNFKNPYGRGAVKKSGGMQNLLDSEVQSYQYMRALLNNPPLIIKGNIPSSVIKYAPAAQWRVGSDPQAGIEPVKLETASLESFPNNYALIKSQIISGFGADDNNSTPAASGAASSKTDTGVAAQQTKLGIADNYVRRQFEAVYEEVLETEINLYFAESDGIRVFTLDAETAEKIRNIDPTLVNDKNQIQIDFSKETEKLRVKVDPSSSEEVDDEVRSQALSQAITIANEDPYFSSKLAADGYDWHPGTAYKELFSIGALRSVDAIITKLPQGKVDPTTGQEQKAQPTWTAPIYDKPTVHIDYKDLPPTAQQQVLGSSQVQVSEQDVLTPNIEQIAGGKSENPVHAAQVDPQTGQIISDGPVQVIDPSTGQPVTPTGAAPDATVAPIAASAPGQALPIAQNGGKQDIQSTSGLPTNNSVAVPHTSGEAPLPTPTNPAQAAAHAAMNPMNHPTLAAMKALGIKPESLAPNQLAHIHNLIGLPDATGPTPDQSKHELEKIKAKHDLAKAANDDTNATVDKATEMAQQQTEQAANSAPDSGAAPSEQPASPAPAEDASVPDMSEDDKMLIDELRKRGYNDQQIGVAVQMLKQGEPISKIIGQLHGGALNG